MLTTPVARCRKKTTAIAGIRQTTAVAGIRATTAVAGIRTTIAVAGVSPTVTIARVSGGLRGGLNEPQSRTATWTMVLVWTSRFPLKKYGLEIRPQSRTQALQTRAQAL